MMLKADMYREWCRQQCFLYRELSKKLTQSVLPKANKEGNKKKRCSRCVLNLVYIVYCNPTSVFTDSSVKKSKIREIFAHLRGKCFDAAQLEYLCKRIDRIGE